MQRELSEEQPHLNGVLGPQRDALFNDHLMRMHDLNSVGDGTAFQ